MKELSLVVPIFMVVIQCGVENKGLLQWWFLFEVLLLVIIQHAMENEGLLHGRLLFKDLLGVHAKSY